MSSIDKRLTDLESITPPADEMDWCMVAWVEDGKTYMRRLSTDTVHEMSSDDMRRISDVAGMIVILDK